MLRPLSRRLSYANVVATLALFLALGGTTYAAITITGRNVRNGSLTAADIRNSSLTGSDIRNGSLSSRDLSADARSVLRGRPGQKGDVGIAGTPGPKGDAGP